MSFRSRFLYTFPAYAWDVRRSAGRSAGRPAGRPGGARVVSGAEKKIIWSRRPRLAASIKCDERLFEGSVWGGFAPPAKNRGVSGAAPPSQNRKISKKSQKSRKYLWYNLFRLVVRFQQLWIISDQFHESLPSCFWSCSHSFSQFAQLRLNDASLI